MVREDEVWELAEEELAVGRGRGLRVRAPVHLDPTARHEEQRPIGARPEERQPIRGGAGAERGLKTFKRLDKKGRKDDGSVSI